MSDHHRIKGPRRNGDDESVPRKSLVDYSRVDSRPVGAIKGCNPEMPAVPPNPTASASNAAAPPPGNRMSSQMEAVVRLMTGREERTIAEKLADSNRPTWEAYKKANEDKLNLEGMDHRKMEEYRRELDEQRDRILARGTNHTDKKKRNRNDQESSGDSDSDSRERRRKHRKRHKKKHKRKRDKSHRDKDSDSDSEESRRKRKKKLKKKKKEKDGGESDGSHYRLSSFFKQGSDDGE